MIGGNDFPVFFFKGFIGFLTREVFGGEDDVVKLVALVINGLQGREGDKGHAALVALVFVQSGYLIGYAACIDKPADRLRMRLPEKNLRRLFMKNDNFPPLFDIVPVDEASGCGFYGFGLHVVRVYAH